MNANNTISMLKKQLIGAAAGALTALVALSSATYAWYVANNIVKARIRFFGMILSIFLKMNLQKEFSERNLRLVI